MIARFSLYDFIAVVVPGIFFVWILSAFLGIELGGALTPTRGDLTETSLLIVVGYVIGLLLQGLSQRYTEGLLLRLWGGFPSARWLLPGNDHFTKKYMEELGAALSSQFGIVLSTDPVNPANRSAAMKRNQEIFRRCQRLTEGNSDLPHTFNAQYGLFRLLLTTFVLLAIIGAIEVVYAWLSARFLDVSGLALLVFSLGGAVISCWRVEKRAEDFAGAVYDIFLANTPKQSSSSASGQLDPPR